MAKDFSNPHKLGFLRLVQILFAFNVIMSIALLSFVAKSGVEMDISVFMEFMNLVLDGVCFWLIWKRMKATRYVVLFLSAANIIVGTIVVIAAGQFDIAERCSSCLIDIILIAYFATSRRVRAVLIQPFNSEHTKREAASDAELYNLKSWRFWRDIIIYFCVFSIVGHWMEAGYCTLIKFGILPGIYDPNSQIWSDWLYPFLVYGFGASACILLFYPVKMYLEKKISAPFVPLLLSFLFNALVCSLIELVMGLILNQPNADGVYPLWDYSTMFCNFMGQVCLQNAIGFGAVATLVTWVVYPLIEKFFMRVKPNTMNVAFIAVVISFGILFFFYCINVALPDLADDGVLNGSTNEQTISDNGDGSNEIVLLGSKDEGSAGVDITIDNGSSK